MDIEFGPEEICVLDNGVENELHCLWRGKESDVRAPVQSLTCI